MRTLGATLLEAMFAPETDECPLVLLDIYDGATHTRVVNNGADLVSNGDTYAACPFSIQLPAEAEERQPQVQLVIDNVDRLLVEMMREATARPTVTMSIVLASAPDTVEIGPLEFTVLQSDYDAQAMQVTLAFESILEETFPAHRMSPATFPGIHGGLPAGTVWEESEGKVPSDIRRPKLDETTTETTGRRGRT